MHSICAMSCTVHWTYDKKSILGGSWTWLWIGPLTAGSFWTVNRTGIFKQSIGARNRVGIELSYWPARLHRLAEFYCLESIPGLHKRLKIRTQVTDKYTERWFMNRNPMIKRVEPVVSISLRNFLKIFPKGQATVRVGGNLERWVDGTGGKRGVVGNKGN